MIKRIFYLSVFITFLLTASCSNQSNKTENKSYESFKVTMEIDFDGKSENLSLVMNHMDAGSSVRDALLKGESNSFYAYKESSHGELGHLLVSFNEVESYDGKYWFYCINGKKANKGIDQQKLKNGDIISWILTDKTNPC